VARFFRQFGLNSGFGVAAEFAEGVKWDFTFGLFLLRSHVQVENVRGNALIELFFTNISHNEDGVKSRQNRTLKVNLLRRVLQVVVTPKHGVRSC